MRGKGVHGVLQELCCGITPAYAGKSLFSGLYIRINGDHPRVCGEKLLDRYWIGTGLSDTKDHPRVCGEKPVRAYVKIWNEGSPPRMRGKVQFAAWFLPCRRITPAYAGKRLKRSRSTVPPVAIVPLFPSVCNKPVVSDGSPAGRDAPLFLPAENAVPASPAYNLRSL